MQVGVDAYSWLHKGGEIQHSVDVEKIGCCHSFVMEFFSLEMHVLVNSWRMWIAVVGFHSICL